MHAQDFDVLLSMYCRRSNILLKFWRKLPKWIGPKAAVTFAFERSTNKQTVNVPVYAIIYPSKLECITCENWCRVRRCNWLPIRFMPASNNHKGVSFWTAGWSGLENWILTIQSLYMIRNYNLMTLTFLYHEDIMFDKLVKDSWSSFRYEYEATVYHGRYIVGLYIFRSVLNAWW
jgi:hypothetical protein